MSQYPMPFPSPRDAGASGEPGRRFPKATVIAIGVVVALIGVGLVVWPFFSASWILVVFFGTALIANGIAVLVRGRGSITAGIGGALLIVAGLIAMAFTGATARALVSFAGFGLITIGALWLAVGTRFARVRPGVAIVPGAVLVVAGVLALVWPGVALAIAAVVGGIVLVLIGIAIAWGATRARPGVGPDDASRTTIIM